MKYASILLSIFGLFSISCSAPQDDRATAVCDCFNQLHRIDPVEETELMNFVADSCKTLYINTLKELEGNDEDKAKFDEAYEFCQNEK